MRIMDIDENTKFRPIDFDTDRYVGMSVINRKDDAPVLIMMSKSSNPPHYMVMDGMYKQMYYLRYADAVDYASVWDTSVPVTDRRGGQHLHRCYSGKRGKALTHKIANSKGVLKPYHTQQHFKEENTMIYPIIANKKNNILRTHHSSYSEEYAQRMCNLYLSDEIHKDDEGKLHKYYRLHAKEPHSIEDALAYDILCPECANRGKLKQIGRVLNYNDLGLYRCPFCDKK